MNTLKLWRGGKSEILLSDEGVYETQDKHGSSVDTKNILMRANIKYLFEVFVGKGSRM